MYWTSQEFQNGPVAVQCTHLAQAEREGAGILGISRGMCVCGDKPEGRLRLENRVPSWFSQR